MQEQILAALKKLGPSSPGQVAAELGMKAGNIGYHAKKLLDAGAIKVAGTSNDRRLALPEQDFAEPAEAAPPPAPQAARQEEERPQGEARAQLAAREEGRPALATRRRAARALHPDGRRRLAPDHRQRRRAAHLHRGRDRGDRLAPLPALRQRLIPMNAPARAIELLEPKVELIPLTAIAPSETHIQALRRARFSKDALTQLADSIRTVGVLQPVVVRPLAALRGLAKFELVAGERRWLAAKQAGLAHISASVRPLTEEEVLEVQLIENLQREGLHELEEAEGYEALMKLKKINADQVAEMVGKSRSYVYARTKLLALCPEARKSFYAGELDASRALLIARIGHHDTQRRALKDIAESWHGGEPMSYREAREHIATRYMLALKDAPFDIKDVALVPKAGACEACPKRTGNQRDLFSDVKNADVCTDPKCFDDKRQAHYRGATVKLEAAGKKVLFGERAKKIFPNWDAEHGMDRNRAGGGYAKLTDTTWTNGGSQKVSALLPEDYEPILVQHPGSGEILKVASQQVVDAATAKLRSSSTTARRALAPKKKIDPETDTSDVAIDQELLKRVIGTCAGAIKAIGRADFIAIVARYSEQWEVSDEEDAVGKLLKVPSYGGANIKAKHLEKLSDKDLGRYLVLGEIQHQLVNDYMGSELADTVLKRLKIDRKALRAAIVEERKKKAEEKKTAAKAPAKKTTKTKAKKAGKAKGKKK